MQKAAASTPSTPAQARHQSEPSAISATPATQSDDPCHQVLHFSMAPPKEFQNIDLFAVCVFNFIVKYTFAHMFQISILYSLPYLCKMYKHV